MSITPPMTPWMATAITDLLDAEAKKLRPGEDNVTVLWPVVGGGFSATSAVPVLTFPSPTRAALRAAPRPYLLLGERATPRGVASVARKVLFGLPAAAPPAAITAADDEQLAAALFRIATEITFGASTALSHAELDKHWTIGVLFPLPAWATDATGTRTWHVDRDRIVAALAAIGAARSPEMLATRENARVLHGADATAGATPYKGSAALSTALALRIALAAKVAAVDFAAMETPRLAAETRWNPYAVLFALVETSVALAARIAADPAKAPERAAFAAAVWGDLTAPERGAVGQTSAGHAWFRRLWTWWGHAAQAVPPAAANSANALKTVLGLVDDDLAKRAPGAVGELEPKMWGFDALPSVGPDTQGKDVPVMAFGRHVAFVGVHFRYDRGTTYYGVSHPGMVTTDQYMNPTGASVPPYDPALVPGGSAPAKAAARAQWGRILTAIGATEGQLDASSSWDGGLVSLGYQQWSMHQPLEGPVLLEHVKSLSGAYFDLVVRAVGIETGTPAAGVPSASGATGVAGLNTPACFYTLSAAAGAAPVRHIAPGGERDPALAAAALADVRANVFDWKQAADGSWRTGKRALQVAARWSVACRYAIELWQAQADLGFYRIWRTSAAVATVRETGMWATVLDKPTVPEGAPGRVATVLELFGTEALQGVVVDMAINTSGHFVAAMRRAVLRTLAALQSTAAPTDRLALDTRFELQLLTDFLHERHYFGTEVYKRVGARLELDHIDTPRGLDQNSRVKVNPVAADRVRTLLATIGEAGSMRSPALDLALARALTAAIVPDTATMSPTVATIWP